MDINDCAAVFSTARMPPVTNKLKYNPAIDGLRTIAILPVIIFHINNNWLTGGFLGVDVFFVISGFLISSIIVREFKDSSFSYSNFYERRIKRIIPAYLFMLVIVTGLCAIIMLPYDFKKFGFSIFSSLFFVSNINYGLRTGDYFSNDAEQWPLLHTWSLSVEEQFYIFWPVCVMGFIYISRRFKKPADKTISIGIAVAFCLSLFLAVLLVGDKTLSKWGYYLVFTRAFELLIGAAMAVIVAKPTFPGFGRLITIPSGIILIACFFYFDRSILHPGVLTIIPCLCVAFLLGMKRSGITYTTLSWAPMVKVGLVSYSLYLWHWPIIALYKYVLDFGIQGSPIQIPVEHAILIIATSFVMAYLSYVFVETPIRKSNIGFKGAFWKIFAIPSTVASTVAVVIFFSNGLPQRLDNDEYLAKYAFNSIDKERCPGFLNLGCAGGSDAGEKRYLLLGNSHAEHYFEFYHDLGQKLGYQIDLAAAGGCSPTYTSLKCRAVFSYPFDQTDNYDGFIVSLSWPSDQSSESTEKIKLVGDYLIKLNQLSKPVILIGEMPTFNMSIDKAVNYKRLFSTQTSEINIKKSTNYQVINQYLKELSEEVNIKFANPIADIESSSLDFSSIDKSGIPNYMDTNHLSVYGSRKLAEHITNQFKHDDIIIKYF